jgi:hypothetical protein
MFPKLLLPLQADPRPSSLLDMRQADLRPAFAEVATHQTLLVTHQSELKINSNRVTTALRDSVSVEASHFVMCISEVVIHFFLASECFISKLLILCGQVGLDVINFKLHSVLRSQLACNTLKCKLLNSALAQEKKHTKLYWHQAMRA